MTDDREHDDASDWLSSQFGRQDADETPKPDEGEAAGPEKKAEPKKVEPGASHADAGAVGGGSAPAWPPAAPAEAAPTEAMTTASGGGFDWGLASRPETPPVPTPPVPTPPVPTPQAEAQPPAEPPRAAGLPPEPEPFDAALAGVPSPEAEPPTMALPWENPATELFAPGAAREPIAEPATELLSGFGTVPADAAAGSPIDALFGATRFRDYETEPATSQNPFARGTETVAVREGKSRAPLPRSQRVLLWIAGGLAALLVLIVLFFLGTKLPHSGSAAVGVATRSATPTPTPKPTALPRGPLAPGTYKWDRLLGGECLDPFTSPWAEKFTVVDCSSPHPAQMVARGIFGDPTAAVTDPSAPATPSVGAPGSTYPGAAALQTQINLLCSAPAVIDFAAAGVYSDIQFAASYPADEEQWAEGDRSYYCFVTRSSGDPITGSLAVAPAP